MSEPGVFERDAAGRLHVSLPAETCTVCDPLLVADRPHGSQSVTVSCEVHAFSVRFFSRRRGVTFTVRASADDHALDGDETIIVQTLRSHFESWPSEMWRLLDSPRRWAVDPDGDPEQAEAALWSALAWLVDGFTVTDAAAWVAAGVPERRLVRPWMEQGFSPAEAGEWVTAGVGEPGKAKTWFRAGVAPSEVPAGWEDPVGWVFIEQVGLPVDPDWGRLWLVASRRFVRVGFDSGRSPAEVEALAAGFAPPNGEVRRGRQIGPLGPLTVLHPWDEETAKAAEAAAAALGGVDWVDAGLCLRAGLSVDETLEVLGRGEDLGPIRTLVGLRA